MARSLNKSATLAQLAAPVLACVLVQPAWAHDQHQTPAITDRLVMDLLFSQLGTNIEHNASCKHAGAAGDQYLSDILSHYLSVLSQEQETVIRSEFRRIQDHYQFEVTFAVSDQEAPWQYGIQFEAAHTQGSWIVQPSTVNCTGL